MNVKHGASKTEYGPGVLIELTGDEVANAIDAWLVAHSTHVSGSRTITVNGELCREGQVYVDPSGRVVAEGKLFDGRGGTFASDPVRQGSFDGKWWFWCEDWASAEGPFETEELCREALAKYAAQLDEVRS